VDATLIVGVGLAAGIGLVFGWLTHLFGIRPASAQTNIHLESIRAAPAAVSPAAVPASRRTKTARDAYGQADYRLPAWVFNASRSDSLRSVMTATLRALK